MNISKINVRSTVFRREASSEEWEIVDNAIDEAMAGYASQVDVVLHEVLTASCFLFAAADSSSDAFFLAP